MENSIADEGGEDLETEEDLSESSTFHQSFSSSTPHTSLDSSSSRQLDQVTSNKSEKAHYRSKQKSRDKLADELELEKVTILKNVSETLVDASKDVDQTFGKQVVSEMKLIKDPLTKMRLRRNIIMMLYDAQENEARLAMQTPWQGHTNYNQHTQNATIHVPPVTPPVSYFRAVEEAYEHERERV